MKKRKGKRKLGKVWIVGAGPGAPDLITERGRKILDKANIILYDDLVDPSSLPPEYSSRRLIRVGKRAGGGTAQARIERLMVKFARRGASVVRLKGGDPFVFGRGGEEVGALTTARIPFEIIPGVSSATGVPTLAGIPLTHRGVASSFTVVTAHLAKDSRDREPEWDLLAHATDTLVIMMGAASFQLIATRLVKAGVDPRRPVALIRWGSWSAERRQFGTVQDGASGTLVAETPSVIVIGEVVRLAKKAESRNLPLAGVRIAVTREYEYNDRLVVALKRAGATVIGTPAISTAPAEMNILRSARRRAYSLLKNIESYDWVVLTSGKAAFHFDLFRRYTIHVRKLWKPRYAAVGPGTARDIETFLGAPPDVIAQDRRQEGIVEALGNVRGKRILFPCAANAREDLARLLRNKGAHVDEFPAYITVPNRYGLKRLASLVQSCEVDVVTFASGSTVRHGLKAMGRVGRKAFISRRTLAASIGPVTSAALRKWGIRPAIQAKRASMEELAAAIVRYYRKHPHAPRLR